MSGNGIVHAQVSIRKSRFGKAAILFSGFVLVGFFGITDYLTGPYLAFSIFYLLPILMVTGLTGRTAGTIVSAAAATTWLLCDHAGHAPYPHFLIPYWNAFVRLGFFLICTFLMSALLKALEHEEALARTDSLTGLHNARSFYEFLAREIERTRRNNFPLSLAYFDLDNFKTINDTHGHATGDQLLQLVADLIREGVRDMDTVARMGGDEFAVLLPETDERGAFEVIERIRAILLNAVARSNWPVTFSVGIAAFEKPPTSVDDAMRKADSLMYEVKNGGKNAVKSGNC